MKAKTGYILFAVIGVLSFFEILPWYYVTTSLFLIPAIVIFYKPFNKMTSQEDIVLLSVMLGLLAFVYFGAMKNQSLYQDNIESAIFYCQSEKYKKMNCSALREILERGVGSYYDYEQH